MAEGLFDCLTVELRDCGTVEHGDSIPHTLYPVPHTLYPVPCTLYPVPCTLCPVPHTLYSVSYAPHIL